MAEDKKVIENRIASMKMWRDRSTNQVTMAVYNAGIKALEKELEKPVLKKAKAKKKGDWK
jgi:hypothetical protein